MEVEDYPSTTLENLREEFTAKGLRRFALFRREDESGVSGTGYVATGCQQPTGRCWMEWQVEPHTAGWYENIEALERVHGHGGRTQVIWLD